MSNSKADIIVHLKKDLLLMQGFKPASADHIIDIGPMENAFPNKTFPLGAVHEFICTDTEATASTSGFLAGLLGLIIKKQGVIVWISTMRTVFPPALQIFGVIPENIIFVDLHREKEILWAMEESLKCGAVSAVVGEIKELNFIASRRLQLAVEQSQVTGFILRQNPRHLDTNACISRWKITALASEANDGLPGLSYPNWKVELIKLRNGKPASWELQWIDGKFQVAYQMISLPQLQKKTG